MSDKGRSCLREMSLVCDERCDDRASIVRDLEGLLATTGIFITMNFALCNRVLDRVDWM